MSVQPLTFKLKESSPEFTLLYEVPYTRDDGKPSVVFIWKAYCRKCGNPFEISSDARAHLRGDKRFGYVHCEEHRLTFDEVCFLGRKKQRENRKLGILPSNAKLTDEDVAEARMLAPLYKITELAKIFNVSRVYMSNIIHNKIRLTLPKK